MKASCHKHILNFKRPSGTSRGVLKQKETWFIHLISEGKEGIGECGILRSLSVDDVSDYEEKLRWTCEHVELGEEKLLKELTEFPSIQFGVEQAFRSLKAESPFLLHPSKFTESEEAININGLIWMGDADFMKAQIKDKLAAGFSCIKMKIGAIDFDTELKLLQSIRNEYAVNDIELRVDANGAFTPENALEKLKRLSEFDLHSIEQPIKQGQLEEMAKLCEITPLPIALDEELIGVFHHSDKKKIIETIQPQYIILKPSLVGGYAGSNEWISLAEQHDIGWWITSALESNIGLNAIAQWTYTLQNSMPQGLGTGGLYTNNFDAPLIIQNGALHYHSELPWNVPYIKN
ncbi:o-succinylbenzoate synthase [Kordia periserrulae]|uniref:O-succinylbenzoate synthase n=1 Tax=Kordia periserrulae TaxID=701523 RepID=A0A2T6C3C7_9FLAO|nr:o-succinylbenzoate synthase [Kordia periserrulae]PTX62815.1 o-succinylbenzoate synthase [Kordia periserrulae]